MSINCLLKEDDDICNLANECTQEILGKLSCFHFSSKSSSDFELDPSVSVV